MDKVLVLIMTTESYKERQNAIRDTWGKDLEYLFYSDHKEIDVIQVVSQEEKKDVVLKTKNLLKLIIEKDIYIKNNRIDSYDWIFFVDDDTFVNAKVLKHILVTLNKDLAYGYVFGGFNRKESFLNGGAGMLISMDMIKNIKNIDVSKTISHGDVAFSAILKNNNIKYLHYPLFNFNAPHPPFDTKEVMMGQITYHHINPSYMKKIYDLVNEPIGGM
jgi:hypothetical protein